MAPSLPPLQANVVAPDPMADWRQAIGQVDWPKVNTFSLLAGAQKTPTRFTLLLPLIGGGSTGTLSFEGSGFRYDFLGRPTAGSVTKGSFKKGNQTLAETVLQPTDLDTILNTLATDFNDGQVGEDTLAFLASKLPPTTNPTLEITAVAASKLEGNSGLTPFTFVVSRTGDTSVSSSARWAVSTPPGTTNPTDRADFSGALSGTVSFRAGETAKTLTVAVLGDTSEEKDETFSLTLSAPSAGTILGTASAAATILNEDLPPPTLAIAALEASKAEGNGGSTPFTFLVSRTGNPSRASARGNPPGPPAARWAASAVPGARISANASDFLSERFPTGSVSFAAGETSKTITVNVRGDSAAEDNEPFRITLSTPSSGTRLGTSVATGTIRNDDAALSIAALSANKAEGNSGATPFTFRVTRTGDLSGVSSAAWSVSGVGSAPTNAGDFSRVVFPSGTVTFAAGESSRTITVNVAGEAAHERDETFRVTLSAPSAGTTLAAASATGTIKNDDAARPASFVIAPLDADQSEGLKGSTMPFTFLLTRNGLSKGTSSVRWGANGAAPPSASNDDFVPSRTGGLPFGTVTFGANDTVKIITVAVSGDLLQEEDENFVVQLSNQVGASVSTVSAFGVIRDDDYVGDSAPNTLVGTERPEYFDGAGQADRITGGGGPDVFGFRFSYTPPGNTPDQSTPTNPDTITDFAFGIDKISLVDFSNPAFNPSPPPPSSLSRAADSAAPTLADLTAEVFADANGALAGNQPLPARGAALVVATSPTIAGVYILVNDSAGGLSDRNDLLIKLGGFSEALPALGALAPGSLFI